MERWDDIAAERRALAADLEGLTDEQWATPSLCGDWTVRQVLGHLVVPHVTSMVSFGVEMARCLGSFDRANSRLAIRQAQRPTADLLADLDRFADGRFTPPGFGWQAPLTDVLVHSLDIRVPLGLPLERPVEPWGPALDLIVSKKGARAFARAARPVVRLVATDLDWVHGEGPEVHGTAADLGLALTGRSARVDALSGPGQPALAGWLGS